MFSLDFIQNLKNRGKVTPDFPELRKRRLIMLFVYDDYQVGGYNNLLDEQGVHYLGRARTSQNDYTLRRQGLYSPPTMFASTDKYVRGFVGGELFAVPPEVIYSLDNVKYNTILSDRQQREVFAHDQTSPHKSFKVKACVYLGKGIGSSLNLMNYSLSTHTKTRVYQYYPSIPNFMQNDTAEDGFFGWPHGTNYH